MPPDEIQAGSENRPATVSSASNFSSRVRWGSLRAARTARRLVTCSMKLTRRSLLASSAAVLVLAAGTLYWMIPLRKSMAKPAPLRAAEAVASPGPPSLERASAPEPFRGGHAPETEPAPKESKPTPQRTPVRPMPPAAVAQLAQHYSGLLERGRNAKHNLARLAAADPDLEAVMKAKLAVLDQSLWIITLAQALDDPKLRPMILQSWTDGRWVVDPLEQSAKEFGYDYQPPRREDAAAFAHWLKRLEPHHQARYAQRLKQLQISDEMAQFAEESAVADLQNLMSWHLKPYGYTYSPDARGFVRPP